MDIKKVLDACSDLVDATAGNEAVPCDQIYSKDGKKVSCLAKFDSELFYDRLPAPHVYQSLCHGCRTHWHATMTWNAARAYYKTHR